MGGHLRHRLVIERGWRAADFTQWPAGSLAAAPTSGALAANQQANSRSTPSTRTMVEARSDRRTWAM